MRNGCDVSRALAIPTIVKERVIRIIEINPPSVNGNMVNAASSISLRAKRKWKEEELGFLCGEEVQLISYIVSGCDGFTLLNYCSKLDIETVY